jgi:hypothetical protein
VQGGGVILWRSHSLTQLHRKKLAFQRFIVERCRVYELSKRDATRVDTVYTDGEFSVTSGR